MTGTPSDTVQASPASAPAHRDSRCSWRSGWYIAATVAAFVVFWPAGVAMLAWACFNREIRGTDLWRKLRGTQVPRPDFTTFMSRKPDNAALAEYLSREQDRLRDEQRKLDDLVQAFEAFKEAERRANDQRDFENFLKQREGGASRPTSTD